MTEHLEEEYTEDYLHAYFGPDADYYLDRLTLLQKGKKLTFNLGAFFFGLLWMLYRKLYLPTLVYLGIVLLQGLALAYVAKQYAISKETISYVDRGLMVIWSVIAGFIGNYLYLRQAQAKVAAVEKMPLGPQEKADRLAQIGGITYVPHIFLLVFLLIGALMM